MNEPMHFSFGEAELVPVLECALTCFASFIRYRLRMTTISPGDLHEASFFRRIVLTGTTDTFACATSDNAADGLRMRAE